MKKKKAVSFVLLIIVLGIAASCNRIPAYPYSLVIIAGRHDNANMYTKEMMEEAGLRDLIMNSIEFDYSKSDNKATAQVVIIVSDGNPTNITQITVEDNENILEYTGFSKSERNEVKEKMADDILDYLLSNDLKADDEEADLFGAISKASKVLKQYSAYSSGEKYLVIMDTGITTSGVLNMCETDILSLSAEEVINGIDEEEIPDLSDVHVQFLNLGNVADDQEQMGSRSSEKCLEKLWTALLEKMGVDEDKISLICVDPDDYSAYAMTDKAGNDSTYYNYKTVSAVKFGDYTGTVTLETFTLYFIKESAEFSDENQEEVLDAHIREIDEFLRANPELHVYVVSSVAHSEEDEDLRESSVAADRAATVKKLLIEKLQNYLLMNGESSDTYGSLEERIVEVDAGNTVFTWRNAPEKTAIGWKANPLNRVVAIIGENSASEIEELRRNGYL